MAEKKGKEESAPYKTRAPNRRGLPTGTYSSGDDGKGEKEQPRPSLLFDHRPARGGVREKKGEELSHLPGGRRGKEEPAASVQHG